MANARLQLARKAGKKRRRNSARSEASDAAEVADPAARAAGAKIAQDDAGTTDMGDDAAARDALEARKAVIDARLQELTLGKPLARQEEPGFDANGVRFKRAHWDYLLQEMEWMSADFVQERKWRVKSARTLSVSLASYHNKLANKAARQQKLEDEMRRRLAARIGRDVKKFWTKIDKIVSYKVKLQADELRKAAMDRHLKNLMSQTERYAAALASSFHANAQLLPAGSAHGDHEDAAGNDGADAQAGGDEDDKNDDEDDEFEAPAEEEEDDETTLEQEEAMEQDTAAQDELALLQQESEMSVDELRARYALVDDRIRDNDDEEAGDSDDSEFGEHDMVDEEDDERTVDIDEQGVSRTDLAEEMSLLQEESEMSVEQLRARYAAALERSEGSDSDATGASDRNHGGGSDEDDDGDFVVCEGDDVDDESTIEAAEKNEFTKQEVDEELEMLHEENELSIEELRARYAKMADGSDVESNGQASDAADDNAKESDEQDYEPSDMDVEDDETTIDEEERDCDESGGDVAGEIDALQKEAEMSLEQLRAQYARVRDDDRDFANGSTQQSPNQDEPECALANEEAAPVNSDNETGRAADGETRSERTTATMVHTSAGYKRPYLLTSRLNLREYQEAGVNWLVSMCEKRINGILADEMGLGKTIQTITMLAHLACTRGLWGPHLIVVPTSCLVNWEMEFKRWCPAFKVLTYLGNAKRRKDLRQGWSKQNAFQICITSYQLVVQDAHCFKRKKWYYLILDEAHNIKNWKSLRWQTLLTFNSQRRLLLTGTPLQNNIMELWALMHFLMPHVFSSRKEFTYWFQNPLTSMVEGEQEVNNTLVSQLHGIIRPFVLRRLKKDVAKQMPDKFEHVVRCKLSKRQRFLYEDFISRSSTRRAMSGSGRGGGNFMSMMNVLMQLRKVCNHPDLFEPRPISSPLDMGSLPLPLPARCGYITDYDLYKQMPYWSSLNLPDCELLGLNKHHSNQWRRLFFYDVSLPLPPDARLPTEADEDGDEKHDCMKYRDQPDIWRRLQALTTAKTNYWMEKRKRVAQISSVRAHMIEPMLGDDLIRACSMPFLISQAMDVHLKRKRRRASELMRITNALNDLVKDPEERIHELESMIRKAVCYVPKVRARPAYPSFRGRAVAETEDFVLSRRTKASWLDKEMREVATRCLNPYYEAFKRTQLFFPDKRLIQFDCGKLQQLDLLLRRLKRGGHRCLIFTQMSSMLNILEIFLNLHGHTYFRLDGSTKVEKRQSLMDRFNHDEKIFCFILSTRSGGLGINLTGADCVIFYDSDWNPAMDAQAQDRAHRIGQTRDVHIYRLVSEHTVEENILKKAQQKRHLDFLVMSEGQFTTDFFSKSNLRELVGDLSATSAIVAEVSEDDDEDSVDENTEEEVTVDAIEDAMAQLEDEEDVVAMQGARQELMSEQREFDEDADKPRAGQQVERSQPSTPALSVRSSADEDHGDTASEGVDDDSHTAGEEEEIEEGHDGEDIASEENVDDAEEDDDSSDDESTDEDVSTRKRKKTRDRNGNDSSKRARREKSQAQLEQAAERAREKAREKQRDMEDEAKLQAWKNSVSSLKNFEESLNPVDRYALHFREDIEPLFSYVPTAAAIEQELEASSQAIDIDEIEAHKMVEEEALIAEGELIAGAFDEEIDESGDATRSGFITEHTRLYKKERAHAHFERRKRQLTGSSWTVLKCAQTNHPFYYNTDTKEATWDRPMILIKNEQLETSRKEGYAGLPSTVLVDIMRHLLPFPDRIVAQSVCKTWYQSLTHPSLCIRVNANDVHQGTVKLTELVRSATRGETILFGSGVYVLNEPLEVDRPIRLLASPDSHVELQMGRDLAQVKWSAVGGVVCGFHFSRHSDTGPSNWQHLLHVVKDGVVRVVYCNFDGGNKGNACVAISGSEKARLMLQSNKIYNGGSSGVLMLSGELILRWNTIHANVHSGVSILGGNAVLRRNKIQKNGRFGIRLLYHAGNVVVEDNIVNDHPCGNIDIENSGRRFVIRWNDMSKDEPDDLPHKHGRLKIKTWIVKQREIKQPVKVPATKPKKPRLKASVSLPLPSKPAPAKVDSMAIAMAMTNPQRQFMSAQNAYSAHLAAVRASAALQQRNLVSAMTTSAQLKQEPTHLDPRAQMIARAAAWQAMRAGAAAAVAAGAHSQLKQEPINNSTVLAPGPNASLPQPGLAAAQQRSSAAAATATARPSSPAIRGILGTHIGTPPRPPAQKLALGSPQASAPIPQARPHSSPSTLPTPSQQIKQAIPPAVEAPAPPIAVQREAAMATTNAVVGAPKLRAGVAPNATQLPTATSTSVASSVSATSVKGTSTVAPVTQTAAKPTSSTVVSNGSSKVGTSQPSVAPTTATASTSEALATTETATTATTATASVTATATTFPTTATAASSATTATATATAPSLATTAAGTAATNTTTEAPKKKRKKRPKMEDYLVDGVIELFDTCDKKVEKVKKPRSTGGKKQTASNKEPATENGTTSLPATPAAEGAPAAETPTTLSSQRPHLTTVANDGDTASP